MDFGNNIKELRTKKGMTQKDLANVLNVTAQAVSRWENNEVEPSISTINQMAELFDCSIDELFGKVKKEETKNDENIIINIHEEKEEKKSEPIQVKTNIALCSCCNKPLYEQEEIKRWKYYNFVRKGRSTHREDASDILCEDCFNNRLNEEKEKVTEQQIEKDKSFKKKRIKAIVYMSLIMAALLFIGIVIAIGTTGNKAIPILAAILVGTAISIFVGSLVLGGTFLADAWLTVASWGFVRFPGIIFNASADGIKFLIAMKVLFFFLGIGFVLLFEALATAVCMALSVIAFPLALYRNIKKIDKENTNRTMSEALVELNEQ